MAIQSVNGRKKTIVDGNNSVRCFYLYNHNTEVSGFTITKGYISGTGDGGGVYCSGPTPVITNCTIRENLADDEGGGISGGTVNNCTISGNSADWGGGTRYGTVNNCTISGNSAVYGGGAYEGTVNNCVISENSAEYGGGGAYEGTVNNSTISGNSADIGGGGTESSTVNNSTISGNSAGSGGGTYEGTVNNCTISGNSAGDIGGGTAWGTVNNSAINGNSAGSGGGISGGTVNNCTISQNSADWGGGTSYSTVNNSIVYYNSASVSFNRSGGTYNYCCTTPDGTNGTGNILAEPMLVNFSHIATNSPCVGEGSTNYTSGVDIDGESWKNLPSIGCDEVYANAISGSLFVAISADNIYTYNGTPLTFFADIKGRASQNIWTFNDGTAETNKVQVTHSWSAFGEYNVILTAFNDTYPAGISNSISIEVLTTNVHYVNTNNSTPVPPYLTWETAAANIQDAVDVAYNGGKIFVTNGTYLLSSQIDVPWNLTIQSVNGPENTIIDGNNSVRCFNLYNNNTIVSGFTITNGNAGWEQYGGGIRCSDTTPTVANCVISGNSAYSGGGTYYGSVNNCAISGNSAGDGGGTFCATVNNCTISGNSGSRGGGTFYGTVNNCTISGNSANDDGGGTYDSTVNNCTISRNSVAVLGGGTFYGTVNNCTISGNSAGYYGGGTFGGTINNCTISINSANDDGGGTYDSTVNNSIVYYNSAPTNLNRNGGTYRYCCTTPDGTNGTDNISAEPMLVTTSHIATNSPCIGAGSTNYTSGVDIGGEAWKCPPSIGCDEVYANAISGSLSVVIIANNLYSYGTPLTFFADIKGKLSRNIWTFNDGTAETNKVQVTHSWSAFGEYNVVLTAFNDTYPAGISNSISIEVLTTNVHYVNTNNSTPDPPYSTWETAAANIQDAVDVAYNGGKIFVTNGTYLLSSQIDVPWNLTIQSVSGPENTIIDGNNSVRCFNLYNNNTIVSGFTITNGNAGSWVGDHGGGVFCSDTTPVITNCTISLNSAGGWGGGIFYGTVNNCMISMNSANNGGGTFYGTVNNCAISGNSAGNNGGGTWVGIVNNCTISGNSAGKWGGGTFQGTVNNSIIYYNSALSDANRLGGTYNYCCTTPDGASGTGNITDLPQFISIIPANYRLQLTSPCINAGNNSYAPMPVDLDGNPRIINGTVDMGCYEFTYPPFIDTTNYPVVIEYSQTTAEISGTNFNIAGNLSWVNSSHNNTTNEFPPGFSTTINNLEHGENIITVSGTNIYGCSTNDVVSIHRKTSIESEPQIETNALIFPSANSVIHASMPTNIIWNVEKITDDIDGTNLTITSITLHYADTTNFILEVTNNIENTLGKIEWYVPPGTWSGNTNYVLKFEVVDSLSLTNSRIFWDNKFIIVPEGGILWIIGLLVSLIKGGARKGGGF